jgi:hypothetical protein
VEHLPGSEPEAAEELADLGVPGIHQGEDGLDVAEFLGPLRKGPD